ncbi:MAG: hypothetical protein J1E58_00780 [Prevotella sp.]|nr:hypothetical protein [Prevotella sp.]
MVTFIILVIILIVGKFLFDSMQQSDKMKSEGGVRKKYKVLVDSLLAADPRNKIFQETNTFVSVGISGVAGSQIFNIQATFGTVTIQMKVSNNPLLGNINMEWQFPESMNQEHMLMKMNDDINKKMQSLMERYQ